MCYKCARNVYMYAFTMSNVIDHIIKRIMVETSGCTIVTPTTTTNNNCDKQWQIIFQRCICRGASFDYLLALSFSVQMI